MVFLLGKSGSGKSTLLNVAGGLDIPDSGELIVKGKSSAEFTPADFDSYRNTYVGFIFQEYNILYEFNVEQNIALALQLQGKGSETAAVEAILKQVDLAGLGRRKPNTLSGGQKQRVAIARALIKEPEIIMADEPTGALDSVTGKEVLETLKKLSKDKLVIVVSHDVEFAEYYGDRIIELKDGKVISDTTKNFAEPTNVSENIRSLDERTVSIKSGGELSKDEFEKVWEIVKSGSSGGGEIIISSDERKVANFKKSNRITEEGSQEFFADTRAEDIKTDKTNSGGARFIKSSLPLARAVKIGASSLKTKPVRLILTILISIMAFGMFGVISTMMLYDVNYTAAKALEGSTYNAAMLGKNYNTHYKYENYYNENGKGKNRKESFAQNQSAYIGVSEIAKCNNEGAGVIFAGVFNLGGTFYSSGAAIENLIQNDNVAGYYCNRDFSGFSDAGEEYLKKAFGYDVRAAGYYPSAANEIAVSYYMYEVIKYFGLRFYDGISGIYGEQYGGAINSPSDLIGRYIRIRYYDNGFGSSFRYLSLKIAGVYNTGKIDERFDELKPNGRGNFSYDEDVYQEFWEIMSGNFHNLGFVSQSFYDAYGYKPQREESEITLGGGNCEAGYSDYHLANYGNNMEFLFYDMLEKYENNTALYSYTTGESLPFSSIKSLKSDETYMSQGNLLNRAQCLIEAYIIDWNDGFPAYRWFRENNSGFVAAYYKLNYYINGIWQGPDNKPLSREVSQSDIATIVKALNADWDKWVVNGAAGEHSSMYGAADKMYYDNGNKYLKIKGVYVNDTGYNSKWVVTKDFIKESGYNYGYTYIDISTNYVMATDAKYSSMITPMETKMSKLNHILALNKPDSGDTFYEMINNTVYSSASSAGYTFREFNWVFVLIGVVLAIISALFLLNYISISIVDKSKEIGILRAVGARGTDVFKIFFSESSIIAAICAVLAIVAAIITCAVVDYMLVWGVFSYRLLNFTFINALIVFAIAALVAFVATIFPVWRAAKRAPVESIRSL